MPITLPNKGIPLTRNTRIYKIRRVEDARVRYRLRLGPFMSEAQANAALGIVREGYPAAFTATAIQEDLEAVADIQFETIAAQPAAKPAPASAAPVTNSRPVELPPTKPVAAAMQPAAKVAPQREVSPPPPAPKTAAAIPAVHPQAAPPLLQSVVPQSVPVAAKSKPAPSAEARAASASAAAVPAVPAKAADPAAKGPPPAARVASPAPAVKSTKPATLTVQPPQPATAAGGAATLAHQVSTMLTSMILELEPDDKPRTERVNLADAPHRQAPPNLRRAEERPAVDLESTQTMRALTTAELEDKNQLSHWYSIELSVADKPFHPDAVPDLDIFSAYRLYVIESKGQYGAIHALRLGFFGEEVAARAVADYLVDHYQKPTVMRVSSAERERFSERRVEARKKVEATGRHTVIEITDQRYIRELSLADR